MTNKLIAFSYTHWHFNVHLLRIAPSIPLLIILLSCLTFSYGLKKKRVLFYFGFEPLAAYVHCKPLLCALTFHSFHGAFL